MLKTKIISLLLVVVLLIGVPVMVSAAVLDPYDYATNITVDGDNEIVYFSLPQEYIYWRMLADGELSAVGSGNVFTGSLQMAWLDNHEIDCYLFGADNYISTDGISVGSDFAFSFDYISSISGRTQTYDELRSVIVDLYDSGMNLIQSVSVWNDSSLDVETNVVLKQSISGIVSGSVLSGCKYFRIRFHIDYNDVSIETDTTVISLRLQNYYAAFSVPYSALYHLRQQGKLTNEKLTAIDEQLQANGQTLDDILKQQEANGDKLDDMNQSIESLPGEIGDQMQGIVDNEKNQANNKGNEFVDQILDALPDPSTKVLASLKSLTDATSYTGTDAKLQIPGIVLPAVGMLIPETELWEGTQLDMGSYMELLPGTLVTVVQSLFTIAIVLYCVY